MAEKIDDIGRHLPGARKHIQNTGQKKTAPEEHHLSLKELWPEPNWADMVAIHDYDPVRLAEVATLYKSIRTSPRPPATLTHRKTRKKFELTQEIWNEAYQAGIQLLRQAINTHIDVEDDFIGHIKRDVLEQFGMDENVDIFEFIDVLAPVFALTRTDKRFAAFWVRSQTMEWLLESLPYIGWPYMTSTLKGRYMVMNRENPVLVYRDGENLYQHDDHDKDMDFLQLCEQAKLLYEEDDDSKFIMRRSDPDKLERIGPDRRAGKDIEPELVLETFGFTGLQFGASMSNVKRQHWVNMHFEALYDLADLLNIPPKWVGLKKVALAFCARGTGGAGAGIAHYENELAAVNITCRRGKGSLAHEWSHFFDDSIGFMFGNQSTYASDMVKDWVPETSEDNDRFFALKTSFKDIHDFLWLDNQSDVLKVSRKLGGYWAQPIEMFARAVESYIEDALIEKGLSSPWLVNGTRLESIHGRSPKTFPYPVGEEREHLFLLVDDFFRAYSQLSPKNEGEK